MNLTPAEQIFEFIAAGYNPVSSHNYQPNPTDQALAETDPLPEYIPTEIRQQLPCLNCCPQFETEDVELVSSQAACSERMARILLQLNCGDAVDAILHKEDNCDFERQALQLCQPDCPLKIACLSTELTKAAN